jgi:3-oxoacyl-[acyl-carrier protein] reductase
MSTPKGVALVTGGSRGIGAAICERLGKDGYHVLINYSSNEARAKAVQDKIQAAGGRADLLPFDVSNSNQVDESIESITKKFGPLEVLVNNAGITIDGLLLRLKDEDLDKTLNIDLKGAIFCTRAAVKPMMKARKGSIIIISSVVGEMGNVGQSAYAAAKSGLMGFAKSVAKELATRNVRVNTITPGYIETEMTAGLSDAQKQTMQALIPMGEIGKPEDIAAAVSYLAGEESRYMTGQVLAVNGGMYM